MSHGYEKEPAYAHESLASSDRRSAWYAKLEGWAARLDTDDADALDALCAEIDEAVGQGEAYHVAAELAHCVRYRKADCIWRANEIGRARAAILDIPMPEGE